jgi:hypothetical protein
LDKLKSDEDAEKFLNDNKILFGLEGCFYLVSISESALARFERRGLPIRDVFDSSFDEVVEIGYLDTAEAVKLLRRRVALLPVPFACLCHCLAGGLPRDLIRSCRSLYLLAPESPGRTLADLSKLLVREDFRRKRHAVELSAKQLDAEASSDFLMALNALEWLEPEVDLFDEKASFFVAVILPNDPSDDDRRLRALSIEFGCFLLYCATLMAFFTDQVSEATIRAAEQRGAFEALGKARQSMSLDPKLSWQLCAEFRRTIGMKCPSPTGETKQHQAHAKLAKNRVTDRKAGRIRRQAGARNDAGTGG